MGPGRLLRLILQLLLPVRRHFISDCYGLGALWIGGIADEFGRILAFDASFCAAGAGRSIEGAAQFFLCAC